MRWYGSIWLGNRKDQMSSTDQISILEIRLDRLRQCLLKWLEEALWNETWHLFSTVCQEYLVANLKLTKSVCVCEERRKRVSLQREVNIRGDQRERCCRLLSVQSVTEQAIHWLDSLFSPTSIQLPANELGKYVVFTFKVAVVGLSFPSGWLESPQLWFVSKYWPSGFFGFTIRRLMSACQSKPRAAAAVTRMCVDSKANLFVVWLMMCCDPRGFLIRTKMLCDLSTASPPPTTYDLTQLGPITSLITPLLNSTKTMQVL